MIARPPLTPLVSLLYDNSIVKLLGAKDRAMGLIEHNNAEIQRYALQCVSKCLVQKWEWVR